MNQSAEHIMEDSGGADVPVCLHCLEPVDPLDKVCPHCGAAVGQLTPYLPYEGIRWSAGIYGQMWDQIWQREVSLAGRVVRLFLVLFFVPLLLVGVVPRVWRKLRGPRQTPESN